MVRWPTARCLQMNPGRQSVFHFSRSGWTRGTLHKQVVELGFSVEKYCDPTRKLLIGNHFAKVGDVLLDSGDLLWPGSHALVRYSGSLFAFCFGEGFEGVLQFLLKGRTGHT